MEQTENIHRLRVTLALSRKEAVLVAAMLAGQADAAHLRAAAAVASQGALRKQMARIRDKLPAGGVTSVRRPTRYALTPAALEGCRLILVADPQGAAS